MLEVDYGKKLMEELWEATPTKVELSGLAAERFLDVHGAMPLYHDNRRAYHRYFMRGKAVLKRGKALLGTYTKDVSRQGVGFLSPVQLLPKEKVQLRLPTTELSLQVARCQRLDQGCFECGAKFVL
jgi:hypothetical protein